MMNLKKINFLFICFILKFEVSLQQEWSFKWTSAIRSDFKSNKSDNENTYLNKYFIKEYIEIDNYFKGSKLLIKGFLGYGLVYHFNAMFLGLCACKTNRTYYFEFDCANCSKVGVSTKKAFEEKAEFSIDKGLIF